VEICKEENEESNKIRVFWNTAARFCSSGEGKEKRERKRERGDLILENGN
jgi:hypothetical protein